MNDCKYRTLDGECMYWKDSNGTVYTACHFDETNIALCKWYKTKINTENSDKDVKEQEDKNTIMNNCEYWDSFHEKCVLCGRILDANGAHITESCDSSTIIHSCKYYRQKGFTDQEDKNVNHPNHYCQGGIECIKAIEASMTPAQFQGYCKGNAIKYMWRYEHKNGIEDLKKARVYLNWMIESLEKENGNAGS